MFKFWLFQIGICMARFFQKWILNISRMKKLYIWILKSIYIFIFIRKRLNWNSIYNNSLFLHTCYKIFINVLSLLVWVVIVPSSSGRRQYDVIHVQVEFPGNESLCRVPIDFKLKFRVCVGYRPKLGFGNRAGLKKPDPCGIV